MGDPSALHTEVTRSTYDAVARQFLERTMDRRGINQMKRTFTAALPSGALILDVGCGPGFDAHQFWLDGYRAIGVDFSLGMLRLAQQEYGGCGYVMADMRQLPFVLEADGIWACASLLHLERENFALVLAQFAQGLGPGGLLCFSVIRGDGGDWDTRYGADHRRWFTFWSETEIDGHLHAHGFHILDSFQSHSGKTNWIRRLARRV